MGTGQVYYERPGPVAAAGIALPVLDILAVLLRFRIRVAHKQGLKWDDWLLIPATLLTLGSGIAIEYGIVNKGVGYAVEIPSDYTGEWLDLRTHQITLNWLVQWAVGLLTTTALTLIKTSVLLFYQRIFDVEKKTLAHFLLRVLIIIVGFWGVAFFFAILFQCRSDFWANYGSAREIEAHCITRLAGSLICHF